MATTAPVRPEQILRDGGYDAIVKAARECAMEFAARVEEHDRSASYAADNIADLWAKGLGNLTIPSELGGVGADLRSSAAAIREIGWGDPSTALILVMHLVHVLIAVEESSAWPEDAKRRIVEESLAGPALTNALRVEPELGTPARGGIPATRATRATSASGAQVWKLSGHKIYSTGSLGLRFMVVWAATAEDDPDGQRVGPFLVPTDTPGIEIRETWDHLGMRGTASNDVVFHEVEIPVGNALDLRPLDAQRPPSPTLATWMTVLTVEVYNGVAHAARDWLTGYLNDRTPSNLGAPLASLERFQLAVGEIESLLYVNEQILESIISATDAGGEAATRAAKRVGLAKVTITANVIRSIEIALKLIGNPGLTYHNPLQRYYRDALCSRIHTPQDDNVLLAVGKAALGR